MKLRIRQLALLLAGVLPMFSCQRDEPSEQSVTQPEGYAQLLRIYKFSQRYSDVLMEDSSLVLVSSEGETVVMSLADMVVELEPVSSAQVVAVGSDGRWMVGGVSTRVYRNEALSDQDAIPFYLYFSTDKSLHLRISNGNHLVIKKESIQIPTVYLTTTDRSGITSKEEYKTGTITIKDPSHLYWDKSEFEAPMRIRGRGNSTWGMPKKSYKIKLDEKACIFDMSTDKEWCLLANYCDKSLLRNITAMEISRRLGFSWTPKMYSVEVYLNGRYDGVYCFSEHKKVSKERVNIDVDAGDMFFEIDQSQDEPVCWTTAHGAPMMFSDPSNPTEEQIAYAKAFFKGFEDALWNKEFSTVYDTYIDKRSFINNFIIQELTKNVDGNLRKSSFITLPVNGKLEMYHVWDFDITLGNCDYYGDGLPTWQGWWVKDQGAIGRYHGWYYRLFMDADFTAEVKARWEEIYPQLQTIPDYIQEQVTLLGEAPERNFQRWKILSTYVWPNAKITGSYEGEVNWLLENYNKRLAWINSQIKSW